MKVEEAGEVLGLLIAGFHRETMDESTIDLWVGMIQPFDAEIATKVALEWIKQEDRFPTISQFRHSYRVKQGQEERTEQPVPLNKFGLPSGGMPDWVGRWMRAREAGDWRVFPEQIAEGAKWHDDPRYTLGEADEIGVMPEDAWIG